MNQKNGIFKLNPVPDSIPTPRLTLQSCPLLPVACTASPCTPHASPHPVPHATAQSHWLLPDSEVQQNDHYAECYEAM